jgi:hypothetical protein
MQNLYFNTVRTALQHAFFDTRMISPRLNVLKFLVSGRSTVHMERSSRSLRDLVYYENVL